MEHNWILVERKLTTSLWKCTNCELEATSSASLKEFDPIKRHVYFMPAFWKERDVKECQEETIKYGVYNTCLSFDERIIRDIIE
jgi:hypothetical protein